MQSFAGENELNFGQALSNTYFKQQFWLPKVAHKTRLEPEHLVEFENWIAMFIQSRKWFLSESDLGYVYL